MNHLVFYADNATPCGYNPRVDRSFHLRVNWTLHPTEVTCPACLNWLRER